MAHSTSIKLAENLKERLKVIAADENRSPNWLMNDAIHQYVERKEQRKSLRQQMRNAHEDYENTGLHLTQDEVREWMEKRARGDRVPAPKPHT